MISTHIIICTRAARCIAAAEQRRKGKKESTCVNPRSRSRSLDLSDSRCDQLIEVTASAFAGHEYRNTSGHALWGCTVPTGGLSNVVNVLKERSCDSGHRTAHDATSQNPPIPIHSYY